MIYIDRVLYPIHVLGPGDRIAIWVKGCRRGCVKCANPDLQDRGNSGIDPADLADMVSNIICGNNVDGITITGGEPFDQPTAIAEFLDLIRGFCGDILIYSGYNFDELRNDPEKKALIDKVDVIIDGEYIDELNDNMVPLRGSVNQNIIYVNKETEERYTEYMSAGRRIQNVFFGNNLISVGIHNRDGEYGKGKMDQRN